MKKVKVKPLEFISRNDVYSAWSKLGFGYKVEKLVDVFNLTITKGNHVVKESHDELEPALESAHYHNQEQVYDLLDSSPFDGKIGMTERVMRMRGPEIVPATKDTFARISRDAHSASYRKGKKISTSVLKFLDKSDRIVYGVLIDVKSES
jgi:hypothetical protein